MGIINASLLITLRSLPPYVNLIKKGVHFTWDNMCKKAFEQMKNALSSTPVLAFPCYGLPFILDVDASESGLGAVMSQCKMEWKGLLHTQLSHFKEARKTILFTKKNCWH